MVREYLLSNSMEKSERSHNWMNNIIIWGMGKYGKAYVDALISCGIKKEKIRLADSNSKLYGLGGG